jgi:hypothetical protein
MNCDGGSASVEVVIRITVGQPDHAPATVLAHHPADGDAMWRPDRVTGEGGEAHTQTVFEPAAAGGAIPCHSAPAVDVELTDNPATDHRWHRPGAVGQMRPDVARHGRPAAPTIKALTGSGRSRLRRPAVTIVAVAVVGIAATLTSLPGPTLAASYIPGAATTGTAQKPHAATAEANVAATGAGAGTGWAPQDADNETMNNLSATSPPTPHPCRRLLVAAALTLRADPATWVITLIDHGGRPGETLDQAIYDRLATARSALEHHHHTDPGVIAARDALDSVIADATRHPCSTTPCSPTEPRTAEHGLAPHNTRGAHAGWCWLCNP